MTKRKENRFVSLRPASGGFTMVELIVTVIIIGIMAAVVAPRFFGKHGFEERGFHDESIAALRYAQKAAIAQRRNVCAALVPKKMTLTIASAAGSASPCNTNLAGPDGKSPYVIDATADTKYRNSNVSFATFPASVTFDSLGRPNAKATIQVTSHTRKIVVEAETGFVHEE